MEWENVVLLLVISFNAVVGNVQTDTPTVEYSIREKFRGRRSTEELYFRCEFENHSNPLTVYQVHWYLDGILTFSSSAVMSNNMNETFLTEENGLQLNKKIACAVKMTFPGNHTEFVSQRSDDYFAGIQINNTFLTIRRGGGIKIRLRLTVPFGCAYYSTAPIDIQNCVLNIQMVDVSHGNCTLDGRTLNNCGLSIRRRDWNDTQEFVIAHDDDISRQFLPYRLIQLKTGQLTSNEIWSNLTMPSVKVYIMDNHMSSTMCEKHENGHQILHKSASVFTALNVSDQYGNIFEIQTRRAKSSGPNNRLCGLAVRAGGDVFIIDACQFPVTKKFKRCTDKAISVKVWKDSSRNFTEVRLLPGIRISVTEYIHTNEAFLVVYICQVNMLPVAEDILDGVSTNLFEMSKSDVNKLQTLMDGSFAVCACLWDRPEAYFIDHDPLNNSTMCSNRDDKICSSEITSFSNLCQIGDRNPDWLLVFKAIAGNGERVFDAWDRDFSKLSYCTPGLGCLSEGDTLNTLSPTSRHLTSPLIKQWDTLNIQKVKVELYSKGNVVMKLVFDGAESDYMNWFSNDRLLYSSYQDMQRNSVYNYFSIQGFFSLGSNERRFHINSLYHGCPGDTGWLTIVDSDTSRRCPWETSLARPQFLYSKGGTMRNWNSDDIGNAEIMAIYVFR